MSNAVIVGSQWGDEGKAKVIDYLTKRSDIIIRFQGGANAGHTVIAEGQKFVFHMVPSGIMYKDKICIIANGVVFDAEQFLKEIDELKTQGISIDNRLFISETAHLVLPYHKAQDNAAENLMGNGKIGTTGRGIGPAYADKAARNGIRIADLVDWDLFTRKFEANLEQKKRLIESVYQSKLSLDKDAVLNQYQSIRNRLLPFITDTGYYLFKESRKGKKMLFEGAQGTFLDIDHGTYPFVTSSSTVSGCAASGCGIGPSSLDYVIGIVKTYTTRVGNGPFPTELNDSIGKQLQDEGGEFGATTGRPRRCGWFDSVMIRKAVQVNGLNRFALTKLDVLNKLDEIKICTHYEIDGKKVDQFPSRISMLEKAVPVYESMEGWNCDISECKIFNDLPSKAHAYIKRIQELCYNVPLLIVSIGPDRNQTIEVNPL
ncbi:MAG TPA: adenylosuccinate synthase [Chitinispirillaceae bacterium]|nr:adenylosuccinate synthase [Chitinispirillaceae bacterium]